MAVPRTGEWLEGEQKTVLGWRVECLSDMHDRDGARFSPEQVLRLAESDCDLHTAADMLAAGCTIDTAFDILT